MTINLRSDVKVELVQVCATDLQVARAAWVSTKGEKALDADSERIDGLINFLMRDKHGSPFEHNMFTFFINCPIFVIREFHRHRAGWSYNEMSGRYTKLLPDFYVPDGDRNLTQTGKPGQYVFTPGTDEQYLLAAGAIASIAECAWHDYEEMLDADIAKEVARMCLPLNIYSSFYATCNARSLMHFLSLRTENAGATYVSHPQKEIQLVSEKMEKIFSEEMPITYKAWNANGRVAP